ncbi:unnamed protein product, partial [Mesorhabditis belari]|uniref:Neurotransmitter-gated ion-channel ligand-binding domain-containing protein n=1 Tax=Mesorhabditis belari TaxID=2138241 RepID=A0AAF3EH25_9BILA
MNSLICFFLVVLILVNGIDYGFYKSEKFLNYSANVDKLYDELINRRKYNKELAPIYEETDENLSFVSSIDNSSTALEVYFVVEYIQIFDLNAQSQLISACMQLRATWFDYRKTLDDIMPSAAKTLKITSDGTVLMATPYYFEVSCEIDITTFPFDNQTCLLPILSYAYDSTVIKSNGTINQETVGEALSGIGNGEWECTGISESSYQFADQQIFQLSLQLKRIPNYYVYVIAFPCFIITLLSVFGMFWTQSLQEEQLAKLGIGLTSLVSMTVLLDLLSTSIPKTAVFPLLGIYVVCCVGIIAGACILIMVLSAETPQKQFKKFGE